MNGKFILLFFLLLFTIISCKKSDSANVDGPETTVHLQAEQQFRAGMGDLLPDFDFIALDGSRVSLSQFEGKLVMINFWATWCGPCIREIPELIELQEEFRDQGMEIIGISLDEQGFSVVEPFLDSFKVNYTIVHDDNTFGNKLGGVYMLPTTYLIDRDGKIVSRKIGEITREDILPELLRLL
jgi:thiol-disulfide isomerase/thioredoxin